MVRVRLLALLAAAVLAVGCRGNKDGSGGNAGGAGAAGDASTVGRAERSSAASPGSDRPLAEFEPVSAADVEMYLGIMREAAERVRTLPASDRQALRTMREMSSRTMASSQMPSPEQMAAVQRAGELLALDAVVARERGVSSRFSSVESRVERFLRPMTGSSGDDDEQMTAEHRAWLQDRIRRFNELDRQDAAVLAPHRAELLALEKQVRLSMHPESMPE